jgi:hypothetical protein
MTFYTLAILCFALKQIVKKLLSIEIVIFHTFALSQALSEKISVSRSQEIVSKNLEKGTLKPCFHLAFFFSCGGGRRSFLCRSFLIRI